MRDFEDRLRNDLATAAEPLGPTTALRGEVDRRVRHHRRVRRAQVAVGVMGALLVVVGVGVFLESDDRGNEPQTFANLIGEEQSSGGESAPAAAYCDLPGLEESSVERVQELVTGTVPPTSPTDSIEARYVGLDEQVALALAGEEGRLARVVCRDGVPARVPLDFVAGRLGLVVTGGTVVAVIIEEPPSAPLE